MKSYAASHDSRRFSAALAAALAALALCMAWGGIARAAGKLTEVVIKGVTPIAVGASVEGDFAVLDATSHTAWSGRKNAKLSPLKVMGRPFGLTVDEKGQTVVGAAEPGGVYSVQLFRGGEKLSNIVLKPSAPISDPVDVASRNEIVWVLERNPARASLYGADGAELGRTDLSEVAFSPFSIALGDGGEAYVTDPMGPAVIELSAFGNYKKTHKLTDTGVTRPSGIAADYMGRLWISDTVTERVIAFKIDADELVPDPQAPTVSAEDPLRVFKAGSTLWIVDGWGGKVFKTELD